MKQQIKKVKKVGTPKKPTFKEIVINNFLTLSESRKGLFYDSYVNRLNFIKKPNLSREEKRIRLTYLRLYAAIA